MKITSLINVCLFILTICFFPLYSLPQFTASGSADDWVDISNILSKFLDDPIAHFADIRTIDDLPYWTDIYEEINGGNYIKELLSRHFKLENIDDYSLDVMFFLLRNYSYPSNWFDDYGIKPIIRRLVEVIQAKPEWFFEALVKRDCWKEYLRLILLDKDIDLKKYLDFIPDTFTRQEILTFINIVEHEKKKEIQQLEEFLKDPINNFEKIKNIYSVSSVMSRRDRLYVDENKNLPDRYFSPGVITDFVEDSPDEKRIGILIHIISHSVPMGVESEVLSESGAKIFFEHPILFARCLSREKNWRSIVYTLSFDLFYLDPGFKKTIDRLGETEFEIKLKEQLAFLSSIIEKKYKKWHIKTEFKP